MNKDLTTGKPEKVLWQFCLPLFGSIIFPQRRIHVRKLIIYTRIIHGGRQMIEDNSCRTALRLNTFSRNSDVIDIKVRQAPHADVRIAGRREPNLLPRQPFH